MLGSRVCQRTVGRDDTYCDFAACYVPVHESWQIGGISFGGYLGLRWLIQ